MWRANSPTLPRVTLGDDWRFCPRCAAALDGASPRPTCAACGFVFFASMGVGVAALVRDAAGRVLLVQRTHRQFGAGQWCIPCGYVEWGEDLRAAAAREALEEAGVAVEIGDVLQVTVNRHDPERPTVGIWFSARLLDPGAEPRAGDDAVAAGWFDPAALPPLAFPTDRPVLARLTTRP
jgi:ADP-ribose pyrophosphatase YjhB (NUDIX family)